MFEQTRSQNNSAIDRDRSRKPLDAIERGVVTIAPPVEADAEPRVQVKPRDADTVIDVYCPRGIASDIGLPPEQSVVYFMRTTRHKGIMLGSWRVDHDGYRRARTFDWPYSTSELRYDEDGNVRLRADLDIEDTDHDRRRIDLAFDAGDIELATDNENYGDGELTLTDGDLTAAVDGSITLTASAADGNTTSLVIDDGVVTVDTPPTAPTEVLRQAELDDHRDNDVHQAAQPPQTHDNTAHTENYISEADITGDGDVASDPHGDDAHDNTVPSQTDVDSAVETHRTGEVHDDPQPLKLTDGTDSTTATTVELGTGLVLNSGTVEATGDGTGDSGAPSGASYITTAMSSGLANEQLHSNLSGSDLHPPKEHSHNGDTLTPDQVQPTDLLRPPEVQSEVDIPDGTASGVFYVKDADRLVVRQST